MKRLFTFLLTIALLGSSVCFAADTTQAATRNSVTVSIDTIETIWNASSPDLQKINAELKTKKTTYDSLYYATLDAIITPTYASNLYARDQAKCAYDIALVQYDKNVRNAILATKQALLTCWTDDLNLAVTKENLTQMQAQLKSYEPLLRQGYISQDTYDNLVSNGKKLENTLNILKTMKYADETKLKSKLGIDQDKTVIYEYPELNADRIAQIMQLDQTKDLEACLTNSIDLKVLQINYDEMNAATYGQKQEVLLNINITKKSLNDKFNLTYANLLTMYESLKASYGKFSDEADKLDKAKKQYALGIISSRDLSGITMEYDTMAATVKSSEVSLYYAYLAYKDMVAGY